MPQKSAAIPPNQLNICLESVIQLSMTENRKVLFYRILGSDLPPRHHHRQTLNNVKFILEHERLASNMERRWILNRLWWSEVERELTQLLTQHNEPFHIIPFDRDLYRQQYLDATGLPPKLNPFRIVKFGPRNHNEVLAFEWIYRRKNLAAIGLNAARNVGIELGIKEARWVFPLDGSTLFREDAQAELRELIRSNPDAKYLIVPMTRFFDNSAVMDPGAKLDKTDEPQIGFRNDATERFNEELRYGNKPKAELLIRLAVPGPWHKWATAPWDSTRELILRDKGKFVIGSWVARLATGADSKVESSDVSRWANRLISVANYCFIIDTALAESKRLKSVLNCYGPAMELMAMQPAVPRFESFSAHR
jgi:hypothetical protein